MTRAGNAAARRSYVVAIEGGVVLEGSSVTRAPQKKFTDAWVAALKHENPENTKEREWADPACSGLVLHLTKRGKKIWKYRGKNRCRVTLGEYPAMSLKVARAAVKSRSEGAKTPWVPFTAVLHTLLDAVDRGDPVTRSMSADARNALVGIEGYEPPCGASRLAATSNKVPVVTLVEDYLEARRAQWAKTTFVTKASSCRRFGEWAKNMTAADITAGSLEKYRTDALNRPRFTKMKGGKRGEKLPTTERRSTVAINNELKTVRMMLQALRKAKRLPNIESSDEIVDNLQTLTDNRQPPSPLKQHEIQALLKVCLRHDEEVDGDEGRQIAPFVVFMLLSGIRLGEALKLTWGDVLLHQELIHVPANKAKMGRQRDVDLKVCPALLRLLRALKVSATSSEARIFDGFTKTMATISRKGLIQAGAPNFLWSTTNTRPGEAPRPTARATCGSFLANAPGIMGEGDGASFFASGQLGHRLDVGQKHYYVRIRGVSPKAKTLEAAMEIQREVGMVITQVERRSRHRKGPLRLIEKKTCA